MSLLDDIKQRVDIVQVVSKYVDLDTRSRIPKGLCPFHSERSPSFVVYPETGTWHCFGGCATGGDAVSFVMKKEGVTFQDALRRLAADLGIKVEAPARQGAPGAPGSDRASELGPDFHRDDDPFHANEIAAQYFRTRLLSQEGEAARKYLEERGITMAAAERRGLGLAPSSPMETLAGHLRLKNVDARAAVDAGLVTKGKDGAWRDMFRGRLTIEIRDARGRICGFGARSLDGSNPKYLNTAQSETFDKSRTLYGLNWAQDAIRATRRAVVVEGYMDAIAAHEHGFTDVVACMGTAVTAEQLETLSHLTGRLQSTTDAPAGRPGGASANGAIILCLDADAAGEAATLRELGESWILFTAQTRRTGVDLLVARPVSGKDPDEMIRTDPTLWQQTLSSARPFIEWMIEATAARIDTSSPDGKVALFESLKGPILSVQNTYEQDRYWTQLSQRMGVSEDRLRSMVAGPATRPRGAGGRNGRRLGEPGTRRSGASDRRSELGPGFRRDDERLDLKQVGEALAAADDALEEYLLSLVLHHEDLREFAAAVPLEHFRDTANREIFNKVRSGEQLTLRTPEQPELQKEANPGADQVSPDDPLASKIEHLLTRPQPPADHLQRVEAVNQCVRRLHERHLRYLKSMQEKAFEELGPGLDQETNTQLQARALEADARLRQVFTGSPAGGRGPGRA